MEQTSSVLDTGIPTTWAGAMHPSPSRLDPARIQAKADNATEVTARLVAQLEALAFNEWAERQRTILGALRAHDPCRAVELHRMLSFAGTASLRHAAFDQNDKVQLNKLACLQAAAMANLRSYLLYDVDVPLLESCD